MTPGHVQMLQLLTPLRNDPHSGVAELPEPGEVDVDQSRISEQEVVNRASIDAAAFKREVLEVSANIRDILSFCAPPLRHLSAASQVEIPDERTSLGHDPGQGSSRYVPVIRLRVHIDP